MTALFWIVGWALVMVLVIVLLGLIVTRVFGVLLKPFVLLGKVIAEAAKSRASKLPRPDDPDYPDYLAWANREGEYSHSRLEWVEVKRLLEEQREERRKQREKWEEEEREEWERKEELRRRDREHN